MMKTLFVLLAVMFITATPFAKANAATTNDLYKQCLETCLSYEETPGYGLRSCVAECQRRFLDKPSYNMTPVQQKNIEWCETYEDECDRPETGI